MKNTQFFRKYIQTLREYIQIKFTLTAILKIVASVLILKFIQTYCFVEETVTAQAFLRLFLLPFLTPNFKKFNFKYIAIFICIIIVLFNPINIVNLILDVSSFRFYVVIFIFIYIFLITYSSLNLLLLYLFTNNIINLTKFKNSSNYLLRILQNKNNIAKSNNVGFYNRIYKINIVVYSILLLFALILYFVWV